MEASLVAKQIEASLVLFYYLFRFPFFLCLLSLWWIDLGLILQNLWRFVAPAWIFLLAMYNVIGQWGIDHRWPVTLWSLSLGAVPTIEIFGATISGWAILNYLSVGPTQAFAFLTQLEMHTVLAWRARKSEKLGTWIDEEFSHARERRAFLAEAVPLPSKAQLWLTGGTSVPRAQYRSVSSSRSSREDAAQRLQKNGRPSPPTWTPPSSPPESEEEGFHNGRVRWKEKGKQYRANPEAIKQVVGMENVIQEIQQSIVIPLKNAAALKKNNVSIKAGILLYGPPGNGKTMLARAVAESLGLYFIAARGSDLQGTLVGSTEQNIASLFTEAKRHAPSVIFLDEIDSIGGKRGGANPFHDAQLAQLLNELEGFDKLENVFLLAATNRLEALDDALIRSGRLGTKIYVPNPSPEAIQTMWKHWTMRRGNYVKFAPEMDNTLTQIPALFKDASGADVAAVAERLRLRMVLDKSWKCTLDDLVVEVERARNQPVDPKVVEKIRHHADPNENFEKVDK